jgi:hypothetical protein
MFILTYSTLPSLLLIFSLGGVTRRSNFSLPRRDRSYEVSLLFRVFRQQHETFRSIYFL